MRDYERPCDKSVMSAAVGLRLPDRESATPAAYLAASGALFPPSPRSDSNMWLCSCVSVFWRCGLTCACCFVSDGFSRCVSGVFRDMLYVIACAQGQGFFFFLCRPATNSSSPSPLFIQSTSLTLPSASLSPPPTRLSASLDCEYSLILFSFFCSNHVITPRHPTASSGQTIHPCQRSD